MSFHLNRTDVLAIHSVQLSMLTERPYAVLVLAVNIGIGQTSDSAPKPVTLDSSEFLEEYPA